jgi:GNAT superfamily N-acetyltransferase
MASRPSALRCIFTTTPPGSGKPGIYLEDLYVTPEARGLGAGKGLLKAIACIAVR